MSISAVLNTKNAEQTLEKTLRSLSFVDEIIVADMKSSDNTRKIAFQFGAVVVPVPDSTHVEPARNAAIAAATSDWILVIDADETVPKTLAAQLTELSQSTTEFVAYEIPRKNILFDAWIQHAGWWPDYILRFFKKGSVTWSDQIHSKPVVRGSIGSLPAEENTALIHENYQTIDQFLQKLTRYTSVEAETRTTKSVYPLSAFKNEFFRRYFAEQGNKDGAHGMAVSLLQSFYEVVVSLKQWEHAGFPKTKMADTTAAWQLQKELVYWLATEKIQNSSGVTALYWRVRRKLGV